MNSGLRILILTPTAMPAVTGNAITVERWRRSLSDIGHTVKASSSANLNAVKLLEEINDFRPDILHAHHLLKSGVLLLNDSVRKAAGEILSVVSPAGTDINQAPMQEGELDTILRLCQASERIITQSQWMLKQARDLLPGMAERILYIPKSIFWQGNESADLRKICGFNHDHFLFFFPAVIRSVKRNLECLECFEPIYTKRRQVRVVFAGPVLDEDYAVRFREEILRLSAFARWIPGIPPVAMKSAYRSADVVLNASFSEGLSNTLMEAIASGKPVLASDIPGNRWPVLGLAEDQPCGLLFDLADATDFIEKAIRLVDEAGLRRKLVEACRLRAASFPTPEEEATAMARVYRELVETSH